ncbi:MAG: helix-turn-helix domain-containing protein [Acidobacteriota bacterium]
MTVLTIREAARLIGRTPATVRRHIRSGRLKAEKAPGKFGEEYRIQHDDLLALGFSPSPPVRTELAEVAGPRERSLPAREEAVPLSLYNELLMKHEQLLVQYGMIRAGGQKLLEFKADAELKAEELRRAGERYQSLRARALKEIRFLRKHMRQAEIEIEERNIEITLLQEKIKRLEMAAAGAASADSLDAKVLEIREKERAVARIEMSEPRDDPTPPYQVPQDWLEKLPRRRGEDH